AIIKGGAAELVGKLGAEQQLFRDFDGTELSLGEWQRLAISRAFYRNSNIMVLDEPTASLDPKEEAHLYQRFIDLAKGHTVLLVTHRLASVRIAEQILVLKDGELVEQGSHEELLAKNEFYAELWQLQASAYKS
ncbi:MAG TPA: ATP-binding cassette domain-containing protein, partial [Trueperaceae bacterium]|nr:ATP-binding cassette domain-containing protein [Trueperaceae bacterium]